MADLVNDILTKNAEMMTKTQAHGYISDITPKEL